MEQVKRSQSSAMGPAGPASVAVMAATVGCAPRGVPSRVAAALLALCAAGCASQPAKAPAASAPATPPATARAAAPADKAALPPSGLSPQDVDALLKHHNKVRADVGVGPLAWSANLAGYARQWAEQLAISGCTMKHRQPNAYGENLFQGTFGAFTAVDAAKAWESEKKDFGGSVLTDANLALVGHYTQMVWRQTSQVGCGQAICRNTLIVACNYDPPGNYMGRKPY